ncbi:hypothetical protein MASR1M60_25990 [Rhodocyclaceae bacterium]
MKPFRSLQLRLLTAFVGLAFLPILVMGVVLMQQLFKLQVEAIGNRQHDQLARVVVESEAFFNNIEVQLHSINRLQRIIRLPAASQRNLLKQLMADWHDVEEIALLDHRGIEVQRLSDKFFVPPDQVAEATNRASQDVFRIPVSSLRSFAGPIRLESETGEPLMELAVPFIDPVSGQAEAVLVATLRVRRLWQLAGSIDLSPGQTVYAVDSRQHIIAHPNPSVVLRQTVAPTDLMQKERIGLAGTPVFADHLTFRFGQQDFTIIAEYAREAALVPTYRALSIVVIALLATLGLAAILFVYLRRVVLNPVKHIAAVAQAIEAGQTGQRAETGSEDEIGQLAYAFNAMTDRLLTTTQELQQVAKTLEQERGFLNTLIRTIPDLVWLKDPEGVYLSCNPRFERLYGASQDNIVGKTDDDFVGKELADFFRAHDRQAMAKGAPSTNQQWLTFADDGHRELTETTKTPMFDANGRCVGVLGIGHDITDLKKYQNQLEALVAERTTQLVAAKETAEAASRAKSTFLANMSHELRTPMNAIMGMNDLILRRTDDPKLRDQLGKIAQASQHLLHVINDILDISKIEAASLRLEQVNFKLGNVLENLMSLLGHRAMEKGLKLLADLDPALARQNLCGDPLRLGQILLNLTGNALKFTAQGAITLRVRLTEESPTALRLHFEVADTGIGISEEHQRRLFTAFEQADSSMTRKYGGTGLGLAISKHLVELMGGEIGVTSTPGQGSTFWFSIPLNKAMEDTGAVPPAPTFDADSAEIRLNRQFAGTRVLLAEDEPINQEVSRGLLEDVGLAVDLAVDGEEAVALAKRNAYALILMDMQMPNLNGVDATRAIRKLPGHENTPILAMTANAFDEDRQTCLGAGMNDHIGKPVDPSRLYEILLKWLLH